MTIAGNGNVGIGTTSPEAKFQVPQGITIGVDVKNLANASVLVGNAEIGIGIDNNEIHQKGDNLNIGVSNFGNESGGGGSIYLRTDSDSDGTLNMKALTVGKTGYITSAYAINEDSDLRYKKDIKSLLSSLEKISALRGVSYYWKDRNDDGEKIGVIAQEVEKVYPQLVHTDSEGYKSVAYSNLVAPMIEAIKELNQTVVELQSQVQRLENEIR